MTRAALLCLLPLLACSAPAPARVAGDEANAVALERNRLLELDGRWLRAGACPERCSVARETCDVARALCAHAESAPDRPDLRGHCSAGREDCAVRTSSCRGCDAR